MIEMNISDPNRGESSDLTTFRSSQRFKCWKFVVLVAFSVTLTLTCLNSSILALKVFISKEVGLKITNKNLVHNKTIFQKKKIVFFQNSTLEEMNESQMMNSSSDLKEMVESQRINSSSDLEEMDESQWMNSFADLNTPTPGLKIHRNIENETIFQKNHTLEMLFPELDVRKIFANATVSIEKPTANAQIGAEAGMKENKTMFKGKKRPFAISTIVRRRPKYIVYNACIKLCTDYLPTICSQSAPPSIPPPPPPPPPFNCT